MADIIDAANEAADIYTRSSLTWRRTAGPAPTGLCLNCDADLGDAGRRWCDTDCRDDWEKRNGKVDLPPEATRETVAGAFARLNRTIIDEPDPVEAALAEEYQPDPDDEVPLDA